MICLDERYNWIGTPAVGETHITTSLVAHITHSSALGHSLKHMHPLTHVQIEHIIVYYIPTQNYIPSHVQETLGLTCGILAHRHTHKQPLPHAHPHSLSLNTYRYTHAWTLARTHGRSHARTHTQALAPTHIMLTHAYTSHAYTHILTCTLTFLHTYILYRTQLA